MNDHTLQYNWLLYAGIWSLHIYSLFSDGSVFSWLSHICFFYCNEGDWNLLVYNSSHHQRRAENSCGPDEFLIRSFAYWTVRLTENVGGLQTETFKAHWLLLAPPAVTFDRVGNVLWRNNMTLSCNHCCHGNAKNVFPVYCCATYVSLNNVNGNCANSINCT